MKQLPILLLALFLATTAQAQNKYAEVIQQGDAALRRGQYKMAINKYFAAEAFDPSKKAVVQGKVNRVFDKIEALRMEADKAKRQAEAALAKANKLINAFYFYGYRFALAFKDEKFYFIDKNGDPVEKLGEWEKAEQFDWDGLAKIKKRDDAATYLLDTFGITYRVVHAVEDLKPDVEALDLTNRGFEQIPEEVFQHSQLKIL
ncbi:MAG: hypothetical protein KDD14_18035, partial [Saprospiraceae bacterium]|nr:hypothetical protein [Saprospiraceae bacterium]